MVNINLTISVYHALQIVKPAPAKQIYVLLALKIKSINTVLAEPVKHSSSTAYNATKLSA